MDVGASWSNDRACEFLEVLLKVLGLIPDKEVAPIIGMMKGDNMGEIEVTVESGNRQFVVELPLKAKILRPGTRWNTFVADLAMNPGQWAWETVDKKSTANQTASNLRRDHGIEATVREVDGEIRVYGRIPVEA